MRTLAFEKEPTFKAVEATSIWGSLISAGASLVGGALASKSAKKAAGTAAAGDQAALQAQREAYDNARGTLQPYVNRGNKGQAYLDALTYGSGSYADAPVYASSPAESLDAILKQQNPGAWATWQGWESRLKPSSSTKGHRAVYGDFQGFLKATDPGALQRAQEALNASVAPGGEAGGTYLTRDDAMSNLYAQPEWQWNEEDYQTRTGMTDADYATRTGMTEADYATRQRMTEADYLARQGFTEDEIAAWMANADVAEGRAVDQMFSRGGITGQVGATQRGVAQVGQDYARDRAQYAAGRKRGDYDIYSGRKDADYGNYSGRKDSDYGVYSGRKISDFDTYAGGKRSAYGSYLDALSDDADRGYEAATGQSSAGQVYANNSGRMRSQGARDQAGYMKDSANAWASGIQGAVGYLSDAWNDRKTTPSNIKINTPKYDWSGVKTYSAADW